MADREETDRPHASTALSPGFFVPTDIGKDAVPFKSLSTHWHGLNTINTLVVFGDSYSAPQELSDDDEGLDSSLSDTANWVDAFQDIIGPGNLDVSNYALGGHSVDHGLFSQFDQFFPQLPHDRGGLKPEETLYVVWIGIEDCKRASKRELEEILDSFFDKLHTLYITASARNIVIMDLPPLDRSPAALSHPDAYSREKYYTWNAGLKNGAFSFASDYDEATIFLFSSNNVLSEVLDFPGSFSFAANDPKTSGGGIWLDDASFTSAVQALLAKRLKEALLSLSPEDPPAEAPEETVFNPTAKRPAEDDVDEGPSSSRKRPKPID